MNLNISSLAPQRVIKSNSDHFIVNVHAILRWLNKPVSTFVIWSVRTKIKHMILGEELNRISNSHASTKGHENHALFPLFSFPDSFRFFSWILLFAGISQTKRKSELLENVAKRLVHVWLLILSSAERYPLFWFNHLKAFPVCVC